MTEHTNTPALRFSEFTEEWEENTLSKLTQLLKDGTHGTHKDVENGAWLLSAKNIKNNSIIFDESDRKISYDDYYKIYKNYQLQKDDLLLSIVGTIGRTALVKNPTDLAFQRSVAVIRFKNQLSSSFFLYLFQTYTFKKKLLRNQVVSAQPGLYLGDLGKFFINHPNNKEQVKIGNFFSKLDRQIELEEKKLELLEQQKRGYMQKIFSQELRVKDVNGNHYPQWTLKNFKEVFQVVPSKKYQIKSSEVEDNANIPVVDQGQNLILGYSNNKEKIFKDFKNVIIYGDHTTFVKKLDKPFIIGGDGVKLLTSKTDNDINYLYNVLQYFNVKPEGYKRHFSILKTKYLYIATSIEEQKRIATLFNKIDKLIENQSKKLDFLKQRKQGLLQKMFI
ncbi:restriction endonuclease subunit S [Staphylococcus hominis]